MAEPLSRSYSIQEKLAVSGDAFELCKTLFSTNDAIPVSGQKPATVSAPAPAFGLGLKPKKAPDLADSGRKKDGIQIIKEEAELSSLLIDWFRWSYEHRLNYGEGGIVMVFFQLKDNSKPLLSFPVFGVPVTLSPQPAKGVFKLLRSAEDPFIFEEPARILSENKLELPSFPDYFEDFNAQSFLKDLQERGVGLNAHQMNPSVFLLRVKCVASVKQPFSTIIQPSGVPVNTTPAFSQLYPSQRKSLEAAEAGHELSSENLPLRLESAAHLALAATLADQKVLVVAETNPLLAGVQNRLNSRNAGSFILPLFKASDRSSLRRLISESIDQTLAQPVEFEGYPDTGLLPLFEKMFRKQTSFNISIAELVEFLLQRENIRELPMSISAIERRTPEQLQEYKSQLASYQKRDEEKYSVTAFWNQVNNRNLTTTEVKTIHEEAVDALEILQNVSSLITQASSQTGLEAPATLLDVSTFEKRLQELQTAPVFNRAMFNHEWVPVPEKVKELFKTIDQVQRLSTEIAAVFHPQIMNEPLEDLLPRLQAQSLSPMKIFNYRYKKELSRLKAYALNAELFVKIDVLWEKLHLVRSQQKLLKKLQDLREPGERYFGADWKGLSTVVDDLQKKTAWLEHFQKRKMERFFSSEESMKTFFCAPRRDGFDSGNIKTAAARLEEVFRQIGMNLMIDNKHDLFKTRTMSFSDIETMLQRLIVQLESFEDYQRYLKDQSVFEEPPLSDFLSLAENIQDLDPESYPEIFEKSFYAALLQRLLAQEPELQRLTFKNVRDLSDALFQESRNPETLASSMLSLKAREFRKKRAGLFESESSFTYLQYELQKQSRFASVDSILRRAGNALSLQAPVWLIRADQLQSVAESGVSFNKMILLDLPENLVSKIQDGGNQAITISKPVTQPKHTFGIGKKTQARAVVSLNAINPHFQRSKPEFQLVACQPYTSENLPFELFEEFVNSKPDCRTSVFLPDEQSLQTFWEQLTVLAASDQNLLFRLQNPAFSGAFSFSTAFSESDMLAEHAFVLVKKDPPVKTVSPFGIKKPAVQSSAGMPAPEELNHFKGTVKIFGETSTDISGFLPAQNRSGSNLLTKLFQQSGFSGNEWQLDPGLHVWEGLLTHTASGGKAYIFSDMPDTAALPLTDRLHAALRVDKTLLFSGLIALRDRETAVNTVFEVAESFFQPQKADLASDPAGKPPNLPQPAVEEDTSASTVAASSPPFQDEFSRWARESDPSKVPVYERVTAKQDIQKPDPALLPRFRAYEMYNGVIMGDRMDFFEAPERRIQKLLVEIVETESPIHLENLFRAVAAYWQIQRRDSHVRSVFVSQLGDLVKKNRLFVKDASVYSNEQFAAEPRNRSGILDFVLADEIPLAELQNAIFKVLESAAPLDEADLLESVSWCLGFPPGFRNLNARVQKAIAIMGDRKQLAWYKTSILLHPDIDPRRKIVGL